MKKPKIMIVDDNITFLETVKQFLSNELNCEVTGEASNGMEFLKIIKPFDVDIVLMDIQMPELDGMTATKEWCLRNPQTKVIAVTMFTEKVYLLPLIEAGFKGCVFKTNFFSEIVQAINKVMNGELYFDTTIAIE